MSINASAAAHTAAVQQHRLPPPNWVKDTGSPAANASGARGAHGGGGTNPFEKLATDLQAALTALQGGNSNATTPAANTSASKTEAVAQLQGDLQSLLSKFQDGGTGQAQGGGKADGAHHHQGLNAAAQAALSTTAPTDSAATGTATASPPSGTPAAPTFVADVLRAFQANFLGGASSGTRATPTAVLSVAG